MSVGTSQVMEVLGLDDGSNTVVLIDSQASATGAGDWVCFSFVPFAVQTNGSLKAWVYVGTVTGNPTLNFDLHRGDENTNIRWQSAPEPTTKVNGGAVSLTAADSDSFILCEFTAATIDGPDYYGIMIRSDDADGANNFEVSTRGMLDHWCHDVVWRNNAYPRTTQGTAGWNSSSHSAQNFCGSFVYELAGGIIFGFPGAPGTSGGTSNQDWRGFSFVAPCDCDGFIWNMSRSATGFGGGAWRIQEHESGIALLEQDFTGVAQQFFRESALGDVGGSVPLTGGTRYDCVARPGSNASSGKTRYTIPAAVLSDIGASVPLLTRYIEGPDPSSWAVNDPAILPAEPAALSLLIPTGGGGGPGGTDSILGAGNLRGGMQ